MTVEIVTTGSELLLGEIVNDNAAYLAAELNKIGFDVRYQTTVGDNRERMAAVLRHALSRADVIITTGGLGPTRGDITKEITAAVCGRQLVFNDAVAARIKDYFARTGRTATERSFKQAQVIDGSTIFQNDWGTAPGEATEAADGKIIVNLPGPPRECRPMFAKALKPFLKEKFGFAAVIQSRILHTYGLGESRLEEILDDLIIAQGNPTIALLVRPTGAIIRLTAKAANEKAARDLIAPLEAEIRERLKEHIYAADNERLEEVVGKLLKSRNLTVAAAESCTGGLIAVRLTEIPGSSAYVKGGIVAYSEAVKIAALGVAAELLEKHTAVSAEVAAAMARGAQRSLAADCAVATTGLAGPDGDGTGRPVGLVYIAAAAPSGKIVVKECHFSGDRAKIRFAASQTALFMLKNLIESEESR